jgi:hypothetical protein
MKQFRKVTLSTHMEVQRYLWNKMSTVPSSVWLSVYFCDTFVLNALYDIDFNYI